MYACKLEWSFVCIGGLYTSHSHTRMQRKLVRKSPCDSCILRPVEVDDAGTASSPNKHVPCMHAGYSSPSCASEACIRTIAIRGCSANQSKRALVTPVSCGLSRWMMRVQLAHRAKQACLLYACRLEKCFECIGGSHSSHSHKRMQRKPVQESRCDSCIFRPVEVEMRVQLARRASMSPVCMPARVVLRVLRVHQRLALES